MAEPSVAAGSGKRDGAVRPPAAAAPTLENGDRLTRCEFERRYAARPDLKKAQLIEGVVYLPSPVSTAHAGPHAMIETVLLVYVASTPAPTGTTTQPSVSISTTSRSLTRSCASRRSAAAVRR